VTCRSSCVLARVRVGSWQPVRASAFLQTGDSNLAQGLVEFALVIPLFVALVIAVTDFTLLVAVQTSMATGTRNASRYGATSGSNSAGVRHYNDCQGIREMVEKATLFASPTVEIRYDPDGPGNAPSYEYCQEGMGSDDIDVSMGGRVTVDSATNYSPIAQYFVRTMPDLSLESSSSHSLLIDIYIK
jgi:Flp pilus assembly protein TadG